MERQAALIQEPPSEDWTEFIESEITRLQAQPPSEKRNHHLESLIRERENRPKRFALYSGPSSNITGEDLEECGYKLNPHFVKQFQKKK